MLLEFFRNHVFLEICGLQISGYSTIRFLSSEINGKECVLKQIWHVGRIEMEYSVLPLKHHTRQYSPGCIKHEKNSEFVRS
jgi:hypothetical protein